jgi:hypothetical protein
MVGGVHSPVPAGVVGVFRFVIPDTGKKAALAWS